MELCEGGELFYQIQSAGSYDESDAALIMSQLCKGLVHCHKHHVCHRDLKPENFLLKAKGDISQLKIIDFGLSRIFTDGKHMHSKAGTPYYIAPEVLKKDYGPECDMWSAGVILYILLCGYPPFWGDNDTEIYNSVKSGQFDYDDPAWDTVSVGPGSARDLIESLLTLDTTTRLTAAQALEHPWITYVKRVKIQLEMLLLEYIFQSIFSLCSVYKFRAHTDFVLLLSLQDRTSTTRRTRSTRWGRPRYSRSTRPSSAASSSSPHTTG
jgi:serine/threonine protein kinase